MSKAGEWNAAVIAAEQIKPKPFCPNGTVEAFAYVLYGGHLALKAGQLERADALRLARWIDDTFGPAVAVESGAAPASSTSAPKGSSKVRRPLARMTVLSRWGVLVPALRAGNNEERGGAA